MKNLISVFFLFLLPLLLSGQQKTYLELNEVAQKIESLLEQYHAAGLSISVVKNNKVIFSDGFGMKDISQALPVNEQTLFSIGSCSKAFTAAMIGVLENKGKLNMTDSPSRFLRDLKFQNKEMDNQVQIHHLLTHSSGLSNMSTESSSVMFPPKSLNGLVSRLKYLQPSSKVGESFMYCNYAYGIASLISENILENPWQENLNTLVFDPLSMKNTVADNARALQFENRALGYAVHENKPYEVILEDMIGRGAAGRVYSNAQDMAKWMITWLNDGMLGDDQVLPNSYVRKAMQPQMKISGAHSSEGVDTSYSAYGYGWFLDNYFGYKKVHHGGAVSGYSSNVALFPELNIGICVLSNQSNSSLPYEVTNLIVDDLLDIQRKENEPNVRFGSATLPSKIPLRPILNISKPPKVDLKNFCGNYSKDGFGTLEIFMKDEHLFVKFPFTTFRLVHDENNGFTSDFAEETPTVMPPFLYFDFNISSNKSVTGVNTNMSENGVEFSRKGF